MLRRMFAAAETGFCSIADGQNTNVLNTYPLHKIDSSGPVLFRQKLIGIHKMYLHDYKLGWALVQQIVSKTN